jgi:phytol kinase
MLILTLADATSALIGTRYGAHPYDAAGSRKSLEGSAAFFFVAFLATFIPLVISRSTGQVEALLTAAVLGLLLMLLEGSAWHGLDNLFIPLGSFLLLKAYLTFDAATLRGRLLVAVVLVAFVLYWRHRTTLEGSGLLAGAFIGYVIWALAGWRWLVPPLVVFVAYTWLSPRTDENSRRIHDVHAVLSVTSAGLLWLLLSRGAGRAWLYGPYTLAFASHLAIIGIARLKYDYPAMRDPLLLAVCVLEGWIVLFVPFLVIEGFSPAAWRVALTAPAGITLAGLAFYAAQPRIDDCPTDRPRWIRQAAAAALGSVAALPLLRW